MIRNFNIAASIIGYSAEMLADARKYGSLVTEVTARPASRDFLRTRSSLGAGGMRVLTKQIYDIAHSGNERSRQNRDEAALIGAFSLLLTDVVDDEIDMALMPLEEKTRYLQASYKTLVEGAAPLPEAQYPYGGSADAVRASFDVAEFIHGKVEALGGEERFAQVFKPLVASIVRQFESSDLDEHLELVRRIGGGCGEIACAAVEIVDASTSPTALEAAFTIGAYAQALDNAYEIEEDLEEGALSYPTLFLARYGDTPKNREATKNTLLELAAGDAEAVRPKLDAQQRTIFDAAGKLIDYKYTVYRSVKNRLAQRQAPEELPAAGIQLG